MAGARTIVTSREPAKLQRALARGADNGVPDDGQDLAKAVLALTDGRGVDVVIENVGAAVWQAALKSAVRGGRIVTCGATSGDQPGADLRRVFIRQLQIFGSTMGNPGEFQDLLQAVAARRLQPVVDSRFGLAQAHAALARLESAQQFGKVMIEFG